MKARLAILFLLLTPITGILHSCRCRLDITTQYITFSHSELRLKNLDNSGASAAETDSPQINKNAYGIRLFLTRERDIIARARQINSVLIQSVHAITIYCPPKYIYTARDSIISIKIFTINDFDNQHLAGADITSYFRTPRSFSTVESLVADMGYTSWDYFGDGWDYLVRKLRIDLLLMFAPTANNLHQFKVQVELSDGRILEQYTTEVELL